MGSESKIFGRGPRELGGAIDLINHYKLWRHYEFFCKRSLPLSISETRYLNNVVGDTEIRKGEEMELDQLLQNPHFRESNVQLYPFALDILSEAFQMRDSNPVELTPVERRIHSVLPNGKSEYKGQERKHKKQKGLNREKEEDLKKQGQKYQ